MTSTYNTAQTLQEQIVIKAKELGFTLIGFAKYEILADEISKLQSWINKGYNAGMQYMERNLEKKKDIHEILPSANSVISLGMNYYKEVAYSNSHSKMKVSKYANGEDYHFVIEDKLKILSDFILTIDPAFEYKFYVDSGPVMDKVWAKKAGLGWIAKNSNLINPQQGSFFFIANVFTNLNFHYDSEILDHCGSCTACITACPTNAIVEPYIIDSNKCISYLTIENKNEIAEKFKNKFGHWGFGCDICQDVCPWNNKFSTPTTINEFYGTHIEFNLDEFDNMADEEFRARFKDSPINRTKLKGMKRNAGFLK